MQPVDAGGCAGDGRAHAPIRSLRDAPWRVADAAVPPAKRPARAERETAGCGREGRRPLAELPHEGGDQVRMRGGRPARARRQTARRIALRAL